MQTWPSSISCGSLPWSPSGMFSLPSPSSSCALSVGFLQCPGLPPRAARALSPPGPYPVAHQAVSNLDTMHLAPSDHSRLFDGINDDLGALGPQTSPNRDKSCLCADKGAPSPHLIPLLQAALEGEAALGDAAKAAADPRRQEDRDFSKSPKRVLTPIGVQGGRLAGLRRATWARLISARLRAAS